MENSKKKRNDKGDLTKIQGKPLKDKVEKIVPSQGGGKGKGDTGNEIAQVMLGAYRNISQLSLFSCVIVTNQLKTIEGIQVE